MTQVVLFNVFNGLIVGAFYALMALGLSLILNLSGVINFAHGGFLALGAYLAYTLIPYIGFWGALILAPPLTAALGLVVEQQMDKLGAKGWELVSVSGQPPGPVYYFKRRK